MTKKEEIIMTLLQELERTITTIMDVLNVPETTVKKSDNEWIPAEFFLPEPYQHVLVSDNDGLVEEDWIIKTWRNGGQNVYGWYAHEDDEIVAWRHMPKGIKRDETKH